MTIKEQDSGKKKKTISVAFKFLKLCVNVKMS